jgi:hypothetical protein
MYLMAVHGAVVLGKPLPLRAHPFGLQVVPLAEVLPETYEAQRQCYSIKSFGMAAGISRATIQREIRAKRLKARKIGKRTVIFHEDAMDYLASLRPVDSQLPPEEIDINQADELGA